MPIARNKNLIFVHIPKNAGESIEKALGMYGGKPGETLWGAINKRTVLQHLTAPELKNRLADDALWTRCTKFAVVRNPWSKAVSEYNWYLRYGPPCSFRDWAFTLPERIAANKTLRTLEIGHNIPQHRFVCDEDGKLLIDRLLRFETITEDFNAFMQDLNLPVTLEHDTATASRAKQSFQSYYDPETIDLIGDIYDVDITYFGYDRAETFPDL
ncbi:MAG: hypothetical protein EP336_02440 [Rhodobacteraceae bacterium]|nr:MAG: hypothetical protein EP336_02440 [Paracoccaceae bacterium]